MGRPVYIVLFLVIALYILSFLPMATPVALANDVVAGICQDTPYPDICVHMVSKCVKRENVDTAIVFNMQAAVPKRHVEAAQRCAKEVAKSSLATLWTSLNLCASIYIDIMDQISSAGRGMGFKDKKMVRVMLEIVVQQLELCNQQFKEACVSNPFVNFDTSLIKMGNNCIALEEMAWMT